MGVSEFELQDAKRAEKVSKATKSVKAIKLGKKAKALKDKKLNKKDMTYLKGNMSVLGQSVRRLRAASNTARNFAAKTGGKSIPKLGLGINPKTGLPGATRRV